MPTTLHRALRTRLLAATVGSSLVLAACSSTPMTPATSGSMSSFRATLSGASEVPANSTTGGGSLTATYDKGTSILNWKLSYSGLTGPATAAHFHGPAMPGTNAPPVVPFSSPASPIEGQTTLTPAQAADLMGGKWYVNVHTKQNPDGEIRGQVMAN